MINLLYKFITLPMEYKQQLLLAAFWLPLTHFRLRYFGLHFCLGLMGRLDAGIAQEELLDAVGYEQAYACEKSVALASRYGVLAGTCLSRALTVIWLLKRRKIAGRLRVGVNLDSGVLDAHAWVEVAGIPLGQGELKYETFPPL